MIISTSPDMHDPEETLQRRTGPDSAFDLLPVLQRRWVTALGAFIVVAGAVIVSFMRTVPLYEARAVITVESGLKALSFQGGEDAERLELNRLNTNRDQLIATPVLRETVTVSGLAESPAYRGASDPVAVLRERVKATTVKDSWSILVTLRDEYPERAQQALSVLLAAYQGVQVEIRDDKSQSGLVFLRAKRDEELAKLEAARAAETTFMNQVGIVSSNPENDLLSRRLVELNLNLVRAETWIAAGSSAHDQLVAAQAVPEANRLDALLAIDAISRDPAVLDQVRAVAQIATEVGALTEKYGDKHPKLIEARGRLTTQRLFLRTSVEGAATAAAILQQGPLQQAAELRLLIADQEQRLKQHRKDLLALSALSEVTESHSKLYQTILTRLNELEVESSLNERKTKIIDPPSAALRPVNQNLTLMLGLSLALGVLAALGAALTRESFDPRLYGADQIRRRTGLPLIGQIPHSRRIQPVGSDGDPDEPSFVAESFRLIRAAVRLARRRPQGCERIAILSCMPGEGKSTVAARLSMSLAAMGARVLLIDGDMRRPTLDDQLGLYTSRGLSLLLAGEPDVGPVATSRPGLDYLGVGVLPTNPGEQLLSSLLPEALDSFSVHYDFLIIDTPPLKLAADALAIAEHTDDLVLVLRDGFTDKDMLGVVMARLGPMTDKLIGFVLNGDSSDPAGYDKERPIDLEGDDPSDPAQPLTAT